MTKRDRLDAPHDPQLDERIERFRHRLSSAGGPVHAIDRGREGLGELWEFILSRRPRPGQSMEEKLRAAGPLPSWYPRQRYVAQSLGPELLQLTDGLAAQVTRLILADETGADWIIEKDPWFGTNLPKLRLPDRRPGPIDEQIAGFVYRGPERAMGVPFDYVPSDPMRLVDDFREFGDTRGRPYSDQSAKEARELLERVGQDHEPGVQSFLATVEAEQGPIGDLDFSADSLVPLWRWLLSQPLPDPHVADREMRRAGPPWWYHFHGILVGQILGPRMSWIATGAAHYFASVTFGLFPDTTWTLGPDPIGGDYRAPLLSVGSNGTLVEQIDVYDMVPRWITLAQDGDGRVTGVDALLKRVDQWKERASKPSPPPPIEIDYDVELLPTNQDGISAMVSFSDDAAHRESARIDHMVRLLAVEDGVVRAHREDREVVYVTAPDVSSAELLGLIDRAWLRVAPDPRAGARSRGGLAADRALTPQQPSTGVE